MALSRDLASRLLADLANRPATAAEVARTAGTLKNLAAAARALTEPVEAAAPLGKKEWQAEVAEKIAAGSGRYATPPTPLRLVSDNSSETDP